MINEFVPVDTLVPLDLEDLKVGDIIRTFSTGRAFYYRGRGRYALDCSITMHKFSNVYDTDDTVAGVEWVLSEDIFYKTYGREK